MMPFMCMIESLIRSHFADVNIKVHAILIFPSLLVFSAILRQMKENATINCKM